MQINNDNAHPSIYLRSIIRMLTQLLLHFCVGVFDSPSSMNELKILLLVLLGYPFWWRLQGSLTAVGFWQLLRTCHVAFSHSCVCPFPALIHTYLLATDYLRCDEWGQKWRLWGKYGWRWATNTAVKALESSQAHPISICKCYQWECSGRNKVPLIENTPQQRP